MIKHYLFINLITRLISREKLKKKQQPSKTLASKSVKKLKHFPLNKCHLKGNYRYNYKKDFIYLFILVLSEKTVLCYNLPKTITVNLCLFNLSNNLMC